MQLCYSLKRKVNNNAAEFSFLCRKNVLGHNISSRKTLENARRLPLSSPPDELTPGVKSNLFPCRWGHEQNSKQIIFRSCIRCLQNSPGGLRALEIIRGRVTIEIG